MRGIVSKIACDNLNTPFQWGVFDCTSPVAQLLEVLFGNSPAQYQGLWRDQESARSYAKEHSYLNALLGFKHKEIEWGREVDGDVFFIEYNLPHDKSHQTTGIVFGSRLLMVTEESGLVLLPLRTIKKPVTILRFLPCHKQ